MRQINAEQKRWMQSVSDWAVDNMDTLYGIEWDKSPFQIHHVVGRSARHNKIAIGHEFILPVPIALHDISSNHPLNVTMHKNKFTSEFGGQSQIFRAMYIFMKHEGFAVPSMEIYDAIMDLNV